MLGVVQDVVGVARKHLQFAYTVLQNSLQQEWAFMQRVSPNVGDDFVSVEQTLRDAFVLALFQGLVYGALGR